MPNPLPKATGAIGLVAMLCLLSSCREEVQTAPPPPPKASARPVDRLAPGELKEGDIDAFGLKVPHGLRLHFRGPDRVEADGDIPAERVANYVRMRTKAQSVELGAARTVFEQAKVLGVESDRRLRIEVVTVRYRTRLIVRDLTPPRIDPALTPEERWKKHGFDKDGKLIDPNKTM
jgi:hypothetical protein